MQLEKSGVTLDAKAAPALCGSTLRMLRDQIAVEPLDWNPSTVLQVQYHGRPLRGRVIAAGPGCWPWCYNRDRTKRWQSKVFRPMSLKVGDTVQLGGLELRGYTFQQVMTADGRHLVICREEDVTGVEEPETAIEIIDDAIGRLGVPSTDGNAKLALRELNEMVAGWT